MNAMRRLKSNASGRSSVSDPRGDSSVKRVKVEQDVESDVISELQSVEKSTKGVEVKQEHMDVKVTDMVASTSNTSSIVKPEKLDYDELPKEMHEMKIKEDKSEDKEIEATVVNGNGTEKGQIIVTSVGDRNGQPKQILHAKVEHQEPSEVHANQEWDVSGVEMQPTSAGQDTSRKIEVPSNKVGVLIGKAGDTVRTLQFNSGARIQITRDADADPNSATRSVEIIGSLENINKAEKLIKDVIAEADVGGSPSLVAKGFSNFQFSTALEQIEIQVPNEKVGFIIGKGGETIKNLQTRSGSRIQVIPQHLPEGDQSKERTVRVTGDKMQIEMAREMIKEAMTQPIRLTASASGYHQQNLRPRGPQSHHTQPNGYDYMQGPPDIYGGQAGHTHVPSGPPAMHARGSGPGPTMGPPPSQANYNYGQLQGPGYGQQPTPYQQTAPQGYHQGPPPSAYPQGTTHSGYMQQDQYSKPPTNNIPQQGPYGQPYGQPQQPPSRNSVGWEQRPPTNMQGPPDIYGGQAGHTHAPSGPPAMHTLGSGPGPTLGPPPSQANYNYGQLQGPGYGQQPTPYQQTAPQGYHQGPPPSAYPQGTTHPGYMQQDQFSKPPTNTIPQQGPYGQPYGQPNQGPLSSSQSYGPNVPAQQPYPYTSSGPMQQSYPQYPVAPSQGGQSGVPQHAPTANAGYGYTQSGPAASYGQYPATQPGFTEQTPTANTGYGYQGVVADGAYAGGPGTTYGPPSGGQPAAYSQSAPIQPGYGQSIPQSSYHQMYVGHR